MKINSTWFAIPPAASQKATATDKSKSAATDFKSALYANNTGTANRMDKLELSSPAMPLSQGIDIAGLRARLSIDARKETSAQKIIGLAEQINNNEYVIDAGELARYIQF